MQQTKEQMLKDLDKLSLVIYHKATTTGSEHNECLVIINNMKRFVEAQFARKEAVKEPAPATEPLTLLPE